MKSLLSILRTFRIGWPSCSLLFEISLNSPTKFDFFIACTVVSHAAILRDLGKPIRIWLKGYYLTSVLVCDYLRSTSNPRGHEVADSCKQYKY